MSEITDLSASQLFSLYSDRQLSPLEVTKAALERIDAYNSSVNAFAIVDKLNVIAHSDVRDWYALPDAQQDYTLNLDRGVAGLRIAYSPNFGYADVEPEVAALVKAAVDVFAKLGAVVEEVDPGFANPRSIFQTLWQAGAAKLLRGFSPEQQAAIEEGLQNIAKEGDRVFTAQLKPTLS